MVTVRNVLLSDAAAIAGIHNYYIQNSAATFTEQDYTVHDIEEKIQRLQKEHYPFLCACDETGKLVGFSYLSTFRNQSAYRLTESSIYLDHACSGKGIGRTLYAELIRQARATGRWSGIIAVITTENEHSVAFHHAMGFEDCGVIPDSGFKFDRWHGIRFMRLPLECTRQ